MSGLLADVAARITRQIEDTVTDVDFGGDHGRMFVDLPRAAQWKALRDRVDWTGLSAAERDTVIDRALRDVREKVPEEIFPATWFDGVLVTVDPAARVYDLSAILKQVETPDRGRNLDQRLGDHARGDPSSSSNRVILARLRADAAAADTPEARLLAELRGLEETLLANHRRYVWLWEAADRLGLMPPVRTAAEIVAAADPPFPAGMPPLPPSLSVHGNAPAGGGSAAGPSPPGMFDRLMAEAAGPVGSDPGPDQGAVPGEQVDR